MAKSCGGDAQLDSIDERKQCADSLSLRLECLYRCNARGRRERIELRLKREFIKRPDGTCVQFIKGLV